MVNPSVVVGIRGSQAIGSQLTVVALDPFAPAVVVARNPRIGITMRRGWAGGTWGVDIAPGLDGGQEQEQAERNPTSKRCHWHVPVAVTASDQEPRHPTD